MVIVTDTCNHLSRARNRRRSFDFASKIYDTAKIISLAVCSSRLRFILFLELTHHQSSETVRAMIRFHKLALGAALVAALGLIPPSHIGVAGGE